MTFFYASRAFREQVNVLLAFSQCSRLEFNAAGPGQVRNAQPSGIGVLLALGLGRERAINLLPECDRALSPYLTS